MWLSWGPTFLIATKRVVLRSSVHRCCLGGTLQPSAPAHLTGPVIQACPGHSWVLAGLLQSLSPAPLAFRVHLPVSTDLVNLNIPYEGAWHTLEGAQCVSYVDLIHIRLTRRCCSQVCMMENGKSLSEKPDFCHFQMQGSGWLYRRKNFADSQSIQNPSLTSREA